MFVNLVKIVECNLLQPATKPDNKCCSALVTADTTSAKAVIVHEPCLCASLFFHTAIHPQGAPLCMGCGEPANHQVSYLHR